VPARGAEGAAARLGTVMSSIDGRKRGRKMVDLTGIEPVTS
jgi:hypothetical protein